MLNACVTLYYFVVNIISELTKAHNQGQNLTYYMIPQLETLQPHKGTYSALFSHLKCERVDLVLQSCNCQLCYEHMLALC